MIGTMIHTSTIAKTVTRRFVALLSKARLSATLGVAISLFSSLLQADQNEVSQLVREAAALVFAQSKSIELPQDFLVRVEGNKLRVALESMGVIEAERSPTNLLVRLLDSSGNEQTATSDELGYAEFSNVKADELHAIVVADDRTNLHAAIPLMTVSDAKAVEKGVESTRLRLPLMSVNREELLASINRDIPPTASISGNYLALDDYALQTVNLYRVRLQPEGTLLGRVIVLDRDLAEKLRYAKLTFFRNNQVVGRTDSSGADGSFALDGLTPGIHGVVAAGPAGYASFAFDVMPALVGEPVDSRPVAFMQTKPADQLLVPLVPPALATKVTEPTRRAFGSTAATSPEAVPSAGTPTPSFAGGGGFGGGGFGGGGNFSGGGSGGGGGIGGGGLGVLAPLIGLAAVIGSDDSNSMTSNAPPPVVSPITSASSSSSSTTNSGGTMTGSSSSSTTNSGGTIVIDGNTSGVTNVVKNGSGALSLSTGNEIYLPYSNTSGSVSQ